MVAMKPAGYERNEAWAGAPAALHGGKGSGTVEQRAVENQVRA
jgi:hypothetical protein